MKFEHDTNNPSQLAVHWTKSEYEDPVMAVNTFCVGIASFIAAFTNDFAKDHESARQTKRVLLTLINKHCDTLLSKDGFEKKKYQL